MLTNWAEAPEHLKWAQVQHEPLQGEVGAGREAGWWDGDEGVGT